MRLRLAVLHAKKKGLLVSYDPNLRPLLWDSLEEARKMMLEGFSYAHLAKVSEEELEFLTGTDDLVKGTEILRERGPLLVQVTLGAKGCFYSTRYHTGRAPTYDLPVKDTTGAGDAFVGGMITWILDSRRPLEELVQDRQALEEMSRFAGAVGALATTKPGGISAMPGRAQVTACMEEAPLLEEQL